MPAPKRSSRSSVQANSAPSTETQKLVAALWVRMTELFGQLWTGRHGPVSAPDGQGNQKPTRYFLRWCDRLGDLTAEQFACGMRAIEKMVEAGDMEYPPSYASFRGYALGTNKTNHKWQHDTPAYRENLPALPKLPTEAEKQTGRQWLQKIRGNLGQSTEQQTEQRADA